MRLMKGYDLDHKMHLLELYDKSERDIFCLFLRNWVQPEKEWRWGRLIFLVQGSLPAGGKGLAQVKLLTNLCRGIYIYIT